VTAASFGEINKPALGPCVSGLQMSAWTALGTGFAGPVYWYRRCCSSGRWKPANSRTNWSLKKMRTYAMCLWCFQLHIALIPLLLASIYNIPSCSLPAQSIFKLALATASGSLMVPG